MLFFQGARSWRVALVLLLALQSGVAAALALEDDVAAMKAALPAKPVVFPAYPEDRHLIPFTVGTPTQNSYFVDANSLMLDINEVRFTLVIRSPSGAENVSYEGVRCGVPDKKIYAFGHSATRSWTAGRGDWQPVTNNRYSPHYALLALQVFCPHGIAPYTMDELLTSLRGLK